MSNAYPTPGPEAPKSRGWFIFLGILSVLVGVFSIGFPLLATVAIEQVLGVVLVVSGVFAIGAVVFGEEKNHRATSVILALIRLAAGMAMLVFVRSGVLAIAAILAAFFVVEGIVFIISSLTLRHNRAWFLIFLNGLVALFLGWLIFSQFPKSAAWVPGLLYGINSIFYGVALLGFGVAHRKA